MQVTIQMANKVHRGDTGRYTVNYDGVTTTSRARRRIEFGVKIARMSGATVSHVDSRVRRGVFRQAIEITGTPAQILAFSLLQDSLEIG